MTYSQGTNSYTFAFDYISKYYVKVRINNNDELTYGTHYTVADKTVALNSVVTLSEGDLIEIFRETPTDKTVEWYDSSILRAQDLNLFNVQLMHINEENMDKLLDSGMQEDKLDSKWDARLKPIKNLANATEDDEAINYGFLKSTQNGYLQASQAKVDEATSKARDAMIQADRAYAQAETAKQNSTNAYNEANRAYSEAERAKSYADKAKTSEDNVSTMKASVEATKTEVDNIKKAVEDTKTASVNAVEDAQAAATADVDSHKASAVTVLDEYKTTVASYRDAAAMSATNAANSAADAATTASQASTSATSAANSATNAANSATEAANSAAKAKTYKDQAEAIVGGDLLTNLDASNTYLKKADASNTYLTQENASSTYLSKTTASQTYATSENLNSALTRLSTAESNITSLTNNKADKTTVSTLQTQVDSNTDAITTKQPKGNYATVEYVDGRVANLVNSAPETLDTLNELANALGNDPNFATTVINQIGTKANTADLVNILYPVGIIVEFAADVDPNTVWQGTTWERMPAGRVLISAGQYSESDYSHNYTLGETGGEATHQLTVDEMPSHQHGGTTSADGAHEHGFWQGRYGGDQYGIATNARGNGEHDVWHTVTGNGNHTHTFATDWRGGNVAHNIVQPYIVVNRWKRTA